MLEMVPVEVFPQVFQIAAKRPSCHVYLVLGKNKNILIDSGIDFNFICLAKALKHIGLNHNDIDIVINTHEHFDPIGGNKHFYNSAIIAAGRLAAAKITEKDEYVTMYSSYTADYRLTKPHIWFEGGVVIDLENFKLEILSTPGHTSDVYAFMKFTINYSFQGIQSLLKVRFRQ